MFTSPILVGRIDLERAYPVDLGSMCDIWTLIIDPIDALAIFG